MSADVATVIKRGWSQLLLAACCSSAQVAAMMFTKWFTSARMLGRSDSAFFTGRDFLWARLGYIIVGTWLGCDLPSWMNLLHSASSAAQST